MIIRHLEELIGTERDVVRGGVNSRRLLLARDAQSYSLHDTLIRAGTELHMWYKHHIESVYCVAGEGELVAAETGEVHAVRDGMFYCLSEHEKHTLRATTDLRLICVFTPALVGPEMHDEDGAFPLLGADVEVTPILPALAEQLAPGLPDATALASVGAKPIKPRRVRRGSRKPREGKEQPA